eukprot:TRINITY_DN2868_c0_g1_i1.p1 TRINITY_DN2868_c0_g1~~TRINITY_DN2868_c0_g1_i1.p1  ORF type:complete len:357 (+),score=37.33 TRINITY_DN2868_c0_g1_i1:54-1073(+)
MAAVPSTFHRRSPALDSAQKSLQRHQKDLLKAVEERVKIVVPEGYQVERAVEIELPKGSGVRKSVIDLEVGDGGGVEVWVKEPSDSEKPSWNDVTVNVTAGKEAAVALVNCPSRRDGVWKTVKTAILSKMMVVRPGSRVNATTYQTNATLHDRSILYANLLHLGRPKSTQRDGYNVRLAGAGSYFKVAGVSLGKQSTHSVDVHVSHEGKGSRSEAFLSSVPSGAKYDCGVRTDIAPSSTEAAALQRLKTHLIDTRSSVSHRPQLNIQPCTVKEAEHGSTIGTLPAPLLHFLRSRGLSTDDAVRKVLLAEMQPTLEHLPYPLVSLIEKEVNNIKTEGVAV